MAHVQLAEISKIFPDGAHALRGFDLAIGDGELVAVVGPPGCGKSTLLRIIAGLETASAGSVIIDGRTLDGLTPQERRIGMASRNSLPPHLTAGDILAFPLAVRRTQKAVVCERVDETARRFGLHGVLDRRPHQLTRCQRHRLALGRAIIRQPELLLVDDLMARLETRPRVELRHDLKTIQRSLGLTTLFATTDQSEALAIADRIVVMRDGRIVQRGRPADVYGRPDDLFVAGFLGSPPMKMVCGTVVETSTGFDVRIGRQTVAVGPLEAADRRLLTAWSGRDVAVGIRPESFHRDAAGSLVVGVVATDELGPDQQLVELMVRAPSVVWSDGVVIGTERRSALTALLGREHVNIWAPLTLAVDGDRIHLFDLETGAPLGAVPVPARAGSGAKGTIPQ